MPRKRADQDLTARQRAFVVAYVACGNATKAAEKAGYGQPRVAGSKLLKVAAVASALAAKVAVVEERARMTRERALELLEGIAEGTITEIELSLSGEPTPGVSKLKDRISAVKQLSKMQGWEAAQKVEHSGSVLVTPASREQALEALQAEARRNPALAAELSKKLLGGG